MLPESNRRMYKLEPINSFRDNLSLPTCMYKVANIHGSVILGVTTCDSNRETNSIVIQQKPSEVVSMIEERQKRLLQQLEILRSQMLAMKQNIVSSTQATTLNSSTPRTKSDLSKDIVINADPRNPPLYLLSLQKSLSLKIRCHTHSNVVQVPAAASEFASKVTLNNPSSHAMSIVLIWKLVGIGTQLMTCSIMPVVICGDVNVLRYLTSAVPSSLTYQHLENSWETDSVLDICHVLQWQKVVKESQNLLRQLNLKLGKNQWLNDQRNYTVADIAAWSAIKQGHHLKILPGTMKGWFQNCENTFQ